MSSGAQFGPFRLLQPIDAVGPLVRDVAAHLDAPSLGLPSEAADLCVLQRLSPSVGIDLELGLRMRQLMAQEARLQHDAIVAVRELGDVDGHPYMAYDLRDGVDLDQLSRAVPFGPPLPAALAVTVVDQVIQALASAHAQGALHGGLTARLVIIDGAGDVSITGFTEGNLIATSPLLAAAAAFPPSPHGARGQTGGGAAALNPRLYAPELRRPVPPALGAAPDCYAVGALLYRLLTGKPHPDEWEPPWAGLMMDMASAGVPGESLSRAVEFFHRTLAERPAQRFASMSALAAAFKPLLGEVGGPKHRSLLAHAVAPYLPHLRASLAQAAAQAAAGSAASAGASVVTTFTDLAPTDDYAITPISDEFVITPDPSPRLTPAHPELLGPAAQYPAHVRSGLTPVSAVRVGFGGPASTHPDDTGPRTRVLSASMRALSPDLRAHLSAPHPLEVLARTRYEVLEELGVGGTGTVYKVRDTTLDEVLALKLLRADLAQDAAWLQRFKRELRIMRDLGHPNIAPAYHLERVEGLCFFTMRFIDGETLHRRLRRTGPLPVAEGARVLCGVGAALSAAHAKGIIHRDFKSANIMIERVTEQPFLMDFGIASIPDSHGLTATGQGIGTPIYMAPEQALGQRISPQADIFSFGVVLYEVFGGALPFQPGTTVAVYHAQVNAQYKPLTAHNPRLPTALIDLTTRCLQPTPDARPASMEEVLAALQPFLPPATS